MRTILAVPFFLGLPLAVPAEGVTFVHKTPIGQELAIDESSLMEIDVEVVFPDSLGGRTKSSGKSLEQKVRIYHQLVVDAPDAGPRRLELVFDTATKETMKPSGKDRVKINTSLHKKRVLVEIDKNTIVRAEPSAGTVTDEDKNDILFAEKLYSALPSDEVKSGKVWSLDADTVGRAIFGMGYDPGQHTVEGKCQFRGTASVEGRKCAKVLLQLKARGQFLDGNAAIELAPEGILLFDLDEGIIRSYDLAGPVKVTAENKIGRLSITGTGKFTSRYKAKVTSAGKKEGADDKPSKPAAESK